MELRLDRYAMLQNWLGTRFPGETYGITPASSDASFRRYFRVNVRDSTQIVMDAPPDKEDCRPFIHVAALLRGAGLTVPEILASDLEQGFLLLTDLGSVTYLNALQGDNPHALFLDAIDALVTWQLATRANVLPPYDEALLHRELNLFPDWYVAKHLKL